MSEPHDLKPQNDGDAWSPLLDATLAGDRRAYEALLRLAIPAIRRYVRRQWPGVQSADLDDIVQETLISLHAVRHTFQVGRPFLPWLFAIARHRLADHRRASYRRAARERGLEPMDETYSEPAANTVFEWPLTLDALGKAIAQLPAKQRQAAELIGLRDMSLREASVASGTSVASLKVASHRAIRSLRRALGVSAS